MKTHTTQKLATRLASLFILASLALTTTAAAANTSSPSTASFQQVLAAAMQHDTEYQAASYTLEAEREEIGLARSQLLPQLNFGAGYSYEDSDNVYTDKDGGYWSEANKDQARYSGKINDNYWRLNLRQPLFDRSRNQDLNRAKSQVKGAEHYYQNVKQELIYRVAELWLQTLYAQMKVEFSQENLDTLNLKLDQAQREDELGVGDQLDLLDIRAHRDLAQADLLEAQSKLAEKLLEVQITTGKNLTPPNSWVAAAYQLEVNQQPQPESYWQNQISNNHNYQEQLARVAQAEAQRKGQRAKHYPTLNLNLDYTTRNSDDEFREKEGFTASLDLSLELYGGGRTSAALRQAQARLNAQQSKTNQAKLSAQQKISVYWARQNNLYQRLQALRHSMLSAQTYEQAAKRGQNLGLKSQIDVVEATARLYQARERHADALISYLLADLSLYFETGQLTEPKLQEYDQLFSQLNP